MAISIVGTPQVGSTIDGGNVTLTFDVTPSEGDVVLVFGSGGLVGGGITATGYTTVKSYVGGAGSYGARCLYKVMGASPDSSVTVSPDTVDGRDVTIAACYVLRGVDTANVLDAAATEAHASGTNAANAPAITTVTNNAWVFALCSGFNGNNATLAAETLTGYGNGVGLNAAETFSTTIRGCQINKATAGSEDPPTYSQGTNSWTCFTVAIRPKTSQTISVGQVSETDLAQAIAWAPKRRFVNQVTETDSAQSVSRLKTRLVAQVSEIDAAQSVSRLKTRLVAQVSEIDAAQTIIRSGVTVPVGQVSEIDLAQAIAVNPMRRLVGQVSEIDSAQTITPVLISAGNEVMVVIANTPGASEARVLTEHPTTKKVVTDSATKVVVVQDPAATPIEVVI